MMIFRISFLLLLLAESVQAAGADLDTLGSDIPEWMAEAAVPGVVVATWNPADTQVRAFGVDENAVFEAASNGKVVAAYELVRLATEGKLSLDDPVPDPRIRSECGDVSIREVLSHTAGLGNNIMADEFVVDCERRGTFSYAGEGYVALESVFESVVGEGSDAYLANRIFKPLAMDRSTMGVSEIEIIPGNPDIVFAVLSSRAGMHEYIAGGVFLMLIVGLSVLLMMKLGRISVLKVTGVVIFAFVLLVVGIVAGAFWQVPVASQNRANDIASTLKTSAPDLLKFSAELASPAQDVSEMFEPAVEVNERTAWGLGIGIDYSDGHTTYWHWGSNPGYQSLMVIDPANQRSIVILTNSGGFLDFFLPERGGYFLARKIARAHLGIDGHWTISPPQ